MKTTPENSELKRAFNKAFCKRTRNIRTRSGLTADEIAEHLDIKLDTYYRYEKSVVMPHYLIARFLAKTGGDPAYLMGYSSGRKRAELRPVE